MRPTHSRLQTNLIRRGAQSLSSSRLRLLFVLLVALFCIVPLGAALLYGSSQLAIYEMPAFWLTWAAGSLWLMLDGGRFLTGVSAETARIWAPGLILLGLVNLAISVGILILSTAGGRS